MFFGNNPHIAFLSLSQLRAAWMKLEMKFQATKSHLFAPGFSASQFFQHWSQTPLQCLVLQTLRVWRKAFSIPCLPSHLLDSSFLLFQPTTAVVTAGNLISAEIMANFVWEIRRELFHSELIKCIFHGTAQHPVQEEATFLSPAYPQQLPRVLACSCSLRAETGASFPSPILEMPRGGLTLPSPPKFWKMVNTENLFGWNNEGGCLVME